jgi:hypothetical protein
MGLDRASHWIEPFQIMQPDCVACGNHAFPGALLPERDRLLAPLLRGYLEARGAMR